MNTEEPANRSPARRTGKQLAVGLSSLVGSRLCVAVLTFISTAILARILSPADFGLMAGAMIIVALTNSIFDGAFAINLVQKIDLTDRYISTAFNLSLIVAILLFGAIVVTSPAIERLFGFPGMATIMVVTATTLVFKAAGVISRALLQRKHQFHLMSLITIVSYFLGYCVVAVTAAIAGYGVWALVAGAVVAGLTEALAYLLAARVPLRWALSREAAREVSASSGLFTISQMLNWVANSGANAITGYRLGAEPLGFYSRGWKLMDAAASVTGAPLQRLFFPAFAQLQIYPAEARSMFVKALGVTVPVFAIISVLMVIHAKAIVLIALGPKWLEMVLLSQLLFLALVPRCASKISESLAFGFARSMGAVIRQAAYAGLTVVCAGIGVFFGPVGVAAGTTLAITIFYCISLGYAARLVEAPLGVLFSLHLRAAIFVVPAAVTDLLVLQMLQPTTNFWIAQGLAAGAAGIATVLYVVLAPSACFGTDVDPFRRRVLRHAAALLRSILRVQAKL